jgi:uncharacterized membrane protein YphA (DoxX/SURF4 family)
MKRQKTYSLITGIIFIISGVGKCMSVSDFSALIIQYGFWYWAFLAPIIVIAEVFIGLLFLFQIQLKKMAVAALVLLILFTAIYSYGYFTHGIEDCGCFGVISLFNLPPVWVFIRNIILVLFAIIIFKSPTTIVFKRKLWKTGSILIVMCGVSFLSGYTCVNEFAIGENTHKYLGKTVQQTLLNDFISTSADSTYLVIAFSYSCSHCLNSI